MAFNLEMMVSNLEAMASNLIAIAGLGEDVGLNHVEPLCVETQCTKARHCRH